MDMYSSKKKRRRVVPQPTEEAQEPVAGALKEAERGNYKPLRKLHADDDGDDLFDDTTLEDRMKSATTSTTTTSDASPAVKQEVDSDSHDGQDETKKHMTLQHEDALRDDSHGVHTDETDEIQGNAYNNNDIDCEDETHVWKKRKIHFEKEDAVAEASKAKATEGSGFVWDEQLQELKEFLEKHGHCNVKQTPVSKLGNFVQTLREQRERKDKGVRRCSILTPSRIKQLDDMGFVWFVCENHHTTQAQTADTYALEERPTKVQGQLTNISLGEQIEQLKAFKEQHGHLRVSPSINRSLATFCFNIRNSQPTPDAKERKQNSKLTEGQVKVLNDIGFDWNSKSKSTLNFKLLMEQLKAYKEEHGHLQVFHKGVDNSLFRCCCNLRSRHPDKDNLLEKLTKDQVKELDDLGFDWNPKNTFEYRIEELKAYREEHGNFKVSRKFDSSIFQICTRMRSRHPSKNNQLKKLNKAQVKALDDIGFDWNPPPRLKRKRMKTTPFELRIEQLKIFKEEHGHLNILFKHDKSLFQFCIRLRARHPDVPNQLKKLTKDQVKILDDLGFDWNPKNKFEVRVEQLKAFKEKHGHLQVSHKVDNSLFQVCARMRSLHPDKDNELENKLTEEQVKVLDDIGFDWSPGMTRKRVRASKFEMRIEQLKAYKEKYGHLQVSYTVDNSLFQVCARMRSLHPDAQNEWEKLTKDQVKELDDIGFDWNPAPPPKRKRGKATKFGLRIEQLKAYQKKYGDLNVLFKHDASLFQFCCHLRSRHPDMQNQLIKLTKEQIKELDDLGFDWQVGPRTRNKVNFEDRVEQLKAFQKEHGHLKVSHEHGKGLYFFCCTVRSMHPDKTNKRSKLSVEKVKTLDDIGFDWNA